MASQRTLFGCLTALVLTVALSATAAVGQEGKPPLTMASYGGAYTRSQMLAYVQPYRELRDSWVAVEDFDGGLDEIRAQVRSANPKWDVVVLELPDAIAGCEEGLLEPIDPAILVPAPDGTPPTDDFFDVAIQPCGIGSDIFATVVAFDERRYATPPTTLADFFDVDRFPGRRALRAQPQVNLEWALIADGVAPADVYDVLATEAGLQRAFAELDRIRDQIVWWTSGDEPPRLLASGAVAMSSAWNGRIFAEVEALGSPLGTIWQHQVWNMDVWAIPTGAVNRAEAMAFVTFATSAERMAAQADLIAYGPARRSAAALVSADVQPYLPTAEKRSDDAIRIDYAWWAEHQAGIQARFAAWLQGPSRFVYDFNPEDGN